MVPNGIERWDSIKHDLKTYDTLRELIDLTQAEIDTILKELDEMSQRREDIGLIDERTQLIIEIGKAYSAMSSATKDMPNHRAAFDQLARHASFKELDALARDIREARLIAHDHHKKLVKILAKLKKLRARSLN